jgi:hypothetical protein
VLAVVVVVVVVVDSLPVAAVEAKSATRSGILL